MERSAKFQLLSLGDVAKFRTEKVSTKKLTLSNYITTVNMLPNKSGIENATSLPPVDRVNEYKIGDILLSNIRPYFKKIWFADRDGGCSADVLTLLVNKGISKEYIYYCLLNDLFFDYVMVGSKGVKMPRGDKKHILKYKVLLPDIEEQNRIVSMLLPFDAKISSNLKLIKYMEEYSQLLFHKWFEDFNFPNENGEPYKDSAGKMHEVNCKMIPVGWKYEPIDEIVDMIIDHRGKTPNKMGGDWSKEGITALSAKIVKDGRLVNIDKANKVSIELYEKWMPKKLAEGDILMTSEAPLGEFYFILIDTEYCLSQRLFAIRANSSRVLPLYLYLELSQPRGLKKIISRQSGSTVFGIRQEELRKVEALVPEYTVQEQFNNLALPIMTKIRMCEKENMNLTEARDLLIKKLIQ